MIMYHLRLYIKILFQYFFEPICTFDMVDKLISTFFLGCFAATQLALQLHQERAQVCGNKEARKRLTYSNGTPTSNVSKSILWG